MNLDLSAVKQAKRKVKILAKAATIRPKRMKHDFSAITLSLPDYQARYIKALNTVNIDLDPEKLKEVAVRNLQGLTGRDFSPLNAFELTAIGKTFYTQEAGAELSPATNYWLEIKIGQLMDKLDALPPTTVAIEKPTRKSVQDYIKENTHDLLAEIDEWLDQRNFKQTLKSYLKDNTVKAINAPLIEQKYARLLIEVTAAVKKTDEQVVEAFKGQKDLSAMQLFLANLIKDVRTFVNEKVSTRKPRAKKIIPPEKKAAKMKFAAADAATGLTSLPPAKLVGALQAWVYNTKTHKLTVYNANDQKALDVKGSTILNWDEKTSITKNVRKPEKLKALVVETGKVGLRKAMDQIKAKASKPKGRVNADTLILRVEK